MKLDGSCHCGKVTFSLESRTPYPYRYCYCKRCLKTHGGIGGVVHIAGDPDTFEVSGEDNLFVYTVRSNPPAPHIPPVELRLHNCTHCGAHLYILSPIWTAWVYPAASAIDSDLPAPPETFHINLSQKPNWVSVPEGPSHVHFDAVPEESIDDWHRRHGVYNS